MRNNVCNDVRTAGETQPPTRPDPTRPDLLVDGWLHTTSFSYVMRDSRDDVVSAARLEIAP